MLDNNQYKHFVTGNAIGNPLLSGPNSNKSSIDNNSDYINNKSGRKGISFEPLSEVVLLRHDSSSSTARTVSFNNTMPHKVGGSISKNKTQSNSKSDLFNIYCSNITSLSDHAIK